jgi:hypothetical protein
MEITKEVAVALISGAGGLVGAVIAWIQAARTAKLKAAADETLEKIKAQSGIALAALKEEGEHRRKALELATQESKPVEDALSQAWRDVQKVKEVIAGLLSRARYDLDLAAKTLTPVVARLVDNYATHGANLPESGREAWHAAKKSAAVIEAVVASLGKLEDLRAPLPQGTRRSLREARVSLTDQQMALAAARQTVREEQTLRILESL